MAKTFNPNRVGGGTVSIVRAADGTYSLKETGFDQISSLNMIDLGAVATTTTAAKTETDRASAKIKLKALGLTDDEVEALSGS